MFPKVCFIWSICATKPLAVKVEDIQQEIIQFKPHVIHFSGHGKEGALAFSNSEENVNWVDIEALRGLFEIIATHVECVVLNACYSETQAEIISEYIDYVIGMEIKIGDIAAENFSTGFYTALFNGDDYLTAYEHGKQAIRLAGMDEQVDIPKLKKRRQTFVPNFKHDVFISFADAEKQWAEELTDYLRKQLRQKLETADGFQLYTGNDLQQLEQSASLLVIASPAYCEQYQNRFAELEKAAKQRPVFLVETDMCNPRPEFLRGFTPHKFWLYDEAAGMMQKITGDSYFAKANELVLAITHQLKELKSQQQHEKAVEEQRQQQQNARDINSDIDALVFLHSSPEDLSLTAEILPLLKENGIDYMLPLPRSETIKAEEICQDIENNIRKCDAVLIIYRESSPVWIRDQLISCRTLQRERKTPLKIIAVHKAKQDDLSCSLKNFQIYDCPPDDVKKYFPHFVEALKK